MPSERLNSLTGLRLCFQPKSVRSDTAVRIPVSHDGAKARTRRHFPPVRAIVIDHCAESANLYASNAREKLPAASAFEN